MEENICVSCLRPKSTLVCGCCEQPVCKKCAQFVEEDAFSFQANTPHELTHSTYCPRCFDDRVAGPLAKYKQLVQQAKEISFFYKDQGKETRRMKRTEDVIHIKPCDDKNEAIMRLAFLAAEAGFNSLIDVDIIAEKVRDGAYQTTVFKGSGVPVNLSDSQLKRK